jgi:hypothetical protein
MGSGPVGTAGLVGAGWALGGVAKPESGHCRMGRRGNLWVLGSDGEWLGWERVGRVWDAPPRGPWGQA